jgi:hypothetical protein
MSAAKPSRGAVRRRRPGGAAAGQRAVAAAAVTSRRTWLYFCRAAAAQGTNACHRCCFRRAAAAHAASTCAGCCHRCFRRAAAAKTDDDSRRHCLRRAAAIRTCKHTCCHRCFGKGAASQACKHTGCCRCSRDNSAAPPTHTCCRGTSTEHHVQRFAKVAVLHAHVTLCSSYLVIACFQGISCPTSLSAGGQPQRTSNSCRTSAATDRAAADPQGEFSRSCHASVVLRLHARLGR